MLLKLNPLPMLLAVCILTAGGSGYSKPPKERPVKTDLSVRKATVHHKGVRRQEYTIEVNGNGQFEVMVIHLYKLTEATSGVYELKRETIGTLKLKGKKWRKVTHANYKQGNRRLYDSLVIVKGKDEFLKWGTSPVFLSYAQKLSKLTSGILIDSKAQEVTDYKETTEYQKNLLGNLGEKRIEKLKQERLKQEVADHNRVALDLSGDGLRAAPRTVKIDGWPLRAKAEAEKIIGNTLTSSENSNIKMTVLLYSKPGYTSFPKSIRCTGIFALYGDRIWRSKTFNIHYPADRPGCMLVTIQNIPDLGKEKSIDVILRLEGKDKQEYLLRDAEVTLEETL